MENQMNYRKVKLLKLLDLLRRENDEQHLFWGWLSQFYR